VAHNQTPNLLNKKNAHNEANVKKMSMKDVIGRVDLRAYTMILALIVIWIFFSFMNDYFLTARNLSNLFLQMSVTSILAIGIVLVIVSGNIDLSVGAIVGLTGGVAAILHVWYDWATLPAILVAIALGALIGLLHGWLVAYHMIPAFIVTLGGMMAYRGILMGITKGQTVAPLDESFKFIGQAYLPKRIGVILGLIAILFLIYTTFNNRRSRKNYGLEVASITYDVSKLVLFSLLIALFVIVMNAYKGIPIPIILVLILAIIFTFIANKTRFGRQVYAIGGNKEAARLSGININRRILVVFMISGTLSAIAGVVLTARVNAATIGAGNMYELDAIAAAVIGGTSLMGGSGTIIGAIIGALVMATLDNGMSIMNLDMFWQYIVKGLILVLAVWVDIYSRNRQNTAK